MGKLPIAAALALTATTAADVPFQLGTPLR